MFLTRRRRRRILKAGVLCAGFCLIYFTYKTISIQKIIRSYDAKILDIKVDLEKEAAVLADLEYELKEVNSLDYIRKIAEDRLGLVKFDVIVIKEKETSD